jgi:hypothetical protein
MKSVIIGENDIYKDWGLDDDYKLPTKEDENIIAIRQMIIDSLEIGDGIPKIIWEYCP